MSDVSIDVPAAGRGTKRLLAAVAVASLIPRVWVALHHPLSYNGAWHLLIARNFKREYGAMAHPPLFVLLLKLCDAVSRSLLSYRFFLLLAGAGSVYLVGRILLKLGARPAVAVLGALAMAASQAAIILSNLVQGYMLCVFFVLASFLHYIDIARMDRPPPTSARIAFAAYASIALLMEYLAAFYIAACVAAPLIAAMMSRDYRRALVRALPRRWIADALTLAPPAAVGLGLHFLVERQWGIGSITYTPFYLQPGENPALFVLRGLAGIVNLFAPTVLPTKVWAVVALAVFLAATVALTWIDRRAVGSVSRFLPALLLVLLLVVGAVLGLLGRYPFGGDAQRHQILFFVFALLAGFVAFDALLKLVNVHRQWALIVLCAAAIGGDVVVNRRDIVEPELEALISKVGLYQRKLADVRTVHLDQFDLVGFLMDHYSWKWRLVARDPDAAWIETYELSDAGRKLTVIAHRNIWIMDFTNPGLYWQLRNSFLGGENDCEAVITVQRNIYGRPPWEPWPGASRDPNPEGPLPEKERVRMTAAIEAISSVRRLEVRNLDLGDYVFAEFCLRPMPGSGATAAESAGPERLLRRWLADFADVRPDDPFRAYIVEVALSGITAGCGGGGYCRDDPVLRAHMASMLLMAKHGATYVPPRCKGVFFDVPCPGRFANWVEQTAAEGMTTGCGVGAYCPGDPVSRAQMAPILLKAEHGASYKPPACRGVFADVPCPSLYADWIEQLDREGITAGCATSPRRYCPRHPATRGQMAVFLVKTFRLGERNR